MSLRDSQPKIAHCFDLLRAAALRQVARAAGYDPETVVESCHEAFLRGRCDAALYERVADSLDALRDAGYLLGVVTNGNADVSRIPQLAGRVSFHVAPSTCGVAKPDPAFFAATIKAANDCSVRGSAPLVAADVCIVGDSLRADVDGALRSGMVAVWCAGQAAGECRELPAGYTAADLRPHLVVQSVPELAAAVLGTRSQR